MLVKSLLLLSVCAINALQGYEQLSPNAGLVTKERDAHPNRHSKDAYEDATLSAPDLIKKYGYPVEKHSVMTDDGYILEMHRIPHGKEANNDGMQKEAVLVLHGLLASSADFILLGPDKALGYVLADSGFDVWLGNARGNYYSRAHAVLDPDGYSGAFWYFSWEEIGRYDVAAMVDYISNTTGQEKMHYIGHSQGATIFLVLNSLRPEYNERFLSAHLLAPIAFMEHFSSMHLGYIAKFINSIYDLTDLMGLHEVFPRGYIMQYEDGHYHCLNNTILTILCRALLSGTTYQEPTKYNDIVHHGHFPAGSSLKQIAHYGQIIEHQAFQRWNYGRVRNLIVYGDSRPPLYELSDVTAESVLYYAESDEFATADEVSKLASVLPNATIVKIERPSFDHFDFGSADDANVMVYKRIVDHITGRKFKKYISN